MPPGINTFLRCLQRDCSNYIKTVVAVRPYTPAASATGSLYSAATSLINNSTLPSFSFEFLGSRLRGNDVTEPSASSPSPACGRGAGGEGNNRLRGNDGTSETYPRGSGFCRDWLALLGFLILRAMTLEVESHLGKR